jgi:hypothetical protein
MCHPERRPALRAPQRSQTGVGLKRTATSRIAQRMRALIAIAVFAVAFLGANPAGASDSQAGLARLMNSGTWKIQASPKDGAANFELAYPPSMSRSGDDVPLTQLGLTPAALRGAAHAIAFDFKTEAGTFACSGRVADSVGGGSFTFVPDEAFAKSYESLRSTRLTPSEQIKAGMFDLRIGYVTAAVAAGFGDANFDTLIGFKVFGLQPEFLQTLHSDFPSTTSSEVVGAWMASEKQGFALHALHLDFPDEDLDAIMALASAGVTPDYVAALRAARVRGLTADGVAVLRTQGVDQAFVDHLAAKGPHGLSVDEVVRLAKGSR